MILAGRRGNGDEPLLTRISKTDYALLRKLAYAKGSTIRALVCEALHLLFAQHGMLPEESTKMLLGQFVRQANKDLLKEEA